MKRFIRLLCVLLALALPASAAIQTPQERLDAAFRKYSTLGACVAVFENGEITFTHTYGVRAIGGEKVTEDTLFQVGSISKMIANIGLLQLMEAKNIPLDAELGDVLGYAVRHPQFPSVPVTLRQLMSHTASLRDTRMYDNGLNGNGFTLQNLLTKQSEYTFYSAYEPGKRREYSNFGGGIIGSVIEQLSGETLDDYMHANVFAPMGINAAFQPARFAADAPFADMFRMPDRYLAKRLSDDKTLVTSPDPDRHYGFTAGKLILSAPDLCRLLIALCDDGYYQQTPLLSARAVGDITTRQDFIGSVQCETGHGLFMNIIKDDQVEGRTLYGHGGKAYGMICAAYFDPADRTGVVMLTNGCEDDSVHNGVGMLGRVIMRICYNRIVNPTHETENPFAVE